MCKGISDVYSLLFGENHEMSRDRTIQVCKNEITILYYGTCSSDQVKNNEKNHGQQRSVLHYVTISVLALD